MFSHLSCMCCWVVVFCWMLVQNCCAMNFDPLSCEKIHVYKEVCVVYDPDSPGCTYLTQKCSIGSVFYNNFCPVWNCEIVLSVEEPTNPNPKTSTEETTNINTTPETHETTQKSEIVHSTRRLEDSTLPSLPEPDVSSFHSTRRLEDSTFPSLREEPDVAADVSFFSRKESEDPNHSTAASTDVVSGHKTDSSYSNGMDCGDKICDDVYEFAEICIMYIRGNDSACNIPCRLDACLQETLINIPCIRWICIDKVTTTSTTTPLTTTSSLPSTTSSSSTMPPSPNNEFSILNIILTVGNAIVICFLLLALLVIFRRRIIQICTRSRNRRNAFRDSPTEEMPLTARSARFRQSSPSSRPRPIVRNPGLAGFSIASSNETGGSGRSDFSNIDLNDGASSSLLSNPDSIERAVERAERASTAAAAAAASLNQSQEPKRKKTKNFLKKEFWKESSC